MNAPQRGEVWLVDFGAPIGREHAGTRPAVIVSANLLNESPAGVVVVVPCTTTARGLPSHIELDAAESNLDVTSYAKCEAVTSISESRLITRLGRASTTAQFEISRVLRFLLDL